jgi:hypothetical protein
MYLFSVAAAELLEWCDIPRTNEDYMAGYQRTLTLERAGEIADYLRKSPANVLPGADLSRFLVANQAVSRGSILSASCLA